jgi:GTP-binding protein Era
MKFGKCVLKTFSELSRTRKFLPDKAKKHLIEKQIMLSKNKIYDGMDSRNENDLEIKKRKVFHPAQHPRLLNNSDSNIVTYKPPAIHLTEFHRVPIQIAQFDEPEFESPIDAKELDIGILGPPNAGKSSLMNKLIGLNISAVSSKSGTTYDSIQGIYTDINDKVQLNFYDTPGATKTSPSIRSKRIMTKAWSVLTECDKILFVVDSVKHLDLVTKEAIKRLLSHKFKPSLLKLINKIKSINEEHISIEQIMKIQKDMDKNEIDSLDYEAKNISSVLVMNKVDLVTNKRKMKTLQEELEDLGAFDKVFHVSCETGYGLENLKNYLKSDAQRRPWRYHPDVSSTLSEKEKCEEILKGIIFNRFYKEIPYGILPRLTSWVPLNNGEIKMKFNVEVKYHVQMSMFVGEKGRVLHEIKAELDKNLTILYKTPVRTVILVVQRKKLPLQILNQMTDVDKI